MSSTRTLAARIFSGARPREGPAWDALRISAANLLLIFVCGCAGLASARGWAAAIRLGALPFLPGEVIKIATVPAVTRGTETATRS